ncbi:putative tyrosinase [Hypomontagnella monticulosa]|nr:putative tyrosinase [Hypomontagnella monticulosa]
MPSSGYEHEDDPSSVEPLIDKTETDALIPSERKQYVAVTTAVIVIITVALFLWTSRDKIEYGSSDIACRQPAVRREWRALGSLERLEYLQAVKCLSSIPSTLCNGTLHDEFAYIHRKIGDYSHEAAPFLPWHRYFIHIYEETLKQRCKYKGTLPYWDWTRDWADLSQSPVWDATEGFGGNGNADTPAAVGDGRCVQNGPFAGLQVQYYGEDWHPHCLSRGFLVGELQDHFGAQRLNSSAMAAVLDEADYYSFLLKLEDGPHSAIPINVRGDFSTFTAPNDPIFFLHHGQVDRLWWKWQNENFKTRALAYDGPSRHNSSVPAQLTDLIEMVGLAPSVPVGSVMTTTNPLLCYKYQ